MMNLKTTLTPAEAEALDLWLNRITFSDLLHRTHGGDDKDQAYLIQAAVIKVRDALAESAGAPMTSVRLNTDLPI